ncbi:class I SAM-dependent methyltransferase [Sporosarcina newyorkensis]|uniref:class I SAM-dependent methyltransferase n=1 Tax=Sporosarcina newyorkensis TaxID=759851 RepID=UPI003D045051
MSYKDTLTDFKTMDLLEMRPEGFLQTILDRQLSNIEAVNAGEGWKNRDYCPVCGSVNKKFKFSKFSFDLYECLECQTGFFDKVPVCTNDVYSSSHALTDAKIAYLANKDYRKERFAKERVELLESILKEDILNKRVLDIGCGTGWFLEYAQSKGAICYGVELGKQLAEFTRELLDITVWNCELADINTEQRFSIITMFDLIEHVYEPVSLLESAKNLLEPNGIILIFTPQFDSVAIHEMKDKSNLIMPSEHLSYFTKNSIEFIASKVDMKLEYYCTKGIDIGDLKSFYEFQQQNEMAEAMVSLYDIIQPTIDASDSGNHLRAVLRKK